MTARLTDREKTLEDAMDTHLRPQLLEEFDKFSYVEAKAGAAVSAAMKKVGDDQPMEKLIRQARKELALA